MTFSCNIWSGGGGSSLQGENVNGRNRWDFYVQTLLLNKGEKSHKKNKNKCSQLSNSFTIIATFVLYGKLMGGEKCIPPFF